MNKYEPLTKLITDNEGNQMVVCRFLDTERCRDIHASCNCITCPMVNNWLQQLHVFEEIISEMEANTNERDR